MTTLNFIVDSGHGWLAVPLDEFPDAEQYGTGFGYIDRRARIIYLEEDVEAGAFMDAHEGIVWPKFVYIDGNAPLRCFPRNEDRLVRA